MAVQYGSNVTNVPKGGVQYSTGTGLSDGKPAPAVYSGGAATKQVNTKIVPTMNTAQGAIAAQNLKIQSDPYTFQPGETIDSYNKRVATYNATKNGADPNSAAPQTPTGQPQPTAADKAATDIANTPDAGHQFAYDATGNKIQLPVGTPVPPGYTTAKPNNPVINQTPVVDSVSTQNGMTYNKYQDGTYGQVDSSGNFVGAITGGDFSKLQQNDPANIAAGIRQSILSVANGSYPLTPVQEAQINGINSQFASLIATQAQANANYTGGVTTAENLYGMGNSIAGLGVIKGTVDSGVQKIAELQSQQASAVAAMQSSFEKDDMTALSAAYSAYNDAATAIQTHIDKLRDYAEQVKTDAANQAHQQFQDAMSSETMDFNQKKEIFDQHMQNAQLSEQQRKDAIDEFQGQERINVEQQNADKTSGTDAQRTSAAVSSLQSLIASGTPLKDGTPVVYTAPGDDRGYMTPQAWNALIAQAPSEGLDRATFIKEFGDKVFVDSDGKVNSSYDLTAEEKKAIQSNAT